MEEEFGRKSIAASKAKLARENLRQGKPPCYSDHGVSRLYVNRPENAASPCGGCPDMLDCHLEVGLSKLGMIDVTPDCYGDPATLDLDNPNETCRACPVYARCGSIVYERERVGQRRLVEGEAIESTGIDTDSPVAPQVNQGEAQP